MENSEAQYDIAFSFAGEDREYVKKVASALKEKGIKIFYDEFEQCHCGEKIYINIYQRFIVKKLGL